VSRNKDNDYDWGGVDYGEDFDEDSVENSDGNTLND